jgi:hypothetical protein
MRAIEQKTSSEFETYSNCCLLKEKLSSLSCVWTLTPKRIPGTVCTTWWSPGLEDLYICWRELWDFLGDELLSLSLGEVPGIFIVIFLQVEVLVIWKWRWKELVSNRKKGRKRYFLITENNF